MPDGEDKNSSQYSSWGGTNNVLISSDNNEENKTNAGGWSGNGQPSTYKYASPNVNRVIYDSDDDDELATPDASHPYGYNMDFLGDPHDVRTIRLISSLNQIRSQQLDPRWKRLRPDVDCGKTVQKELKKFQEWSCSEPIDGTLNWNTEQSLTKYLQNPSYCLSPEESFFIENESKIATILGDISTIFDSVLNLNGSVAGGIVGEAAIATTIERTAAQTLANNKTRLEALLIELKDVLREADSLESTNFKGIARNRMWKEDVIGRIKEVSPDTRVLIEKSIFENGGKYVDPKLIEAPKPITPPPAKPPTSTLGKVLKHSGKVATIIVLADLLYHSYRVAAADESEKGERIADLVDSSIGAVTSIAVPALASAGTIIAITTATGTAVTPIVGTIIGLGVGLIYVAVDLTVMGLTGGTSFTDILGKGVKSVVSFLMTNELRNKNTRERLEVAKQGGGFENFNYPW